MIVVQVGKCHNIKALPLSLREFGLELRCEVDPEIIPVVWIPRVRVVEQQAPPVGKIDLDAVRVTERVECNSMHFSADSWYVGFFVRASQGEVIEGNYR